MYQLFDKVIYISDGRTYFVIEIDDGDDGPIYGIESDDQYIDDWFHWATENELRNPL